MHVTQMDTQWFFTDLCSSRWEVYKVSTVEVNQWCEDMMF